MPITNARHPREGGDPGLKPCFKKMLKAWIPVRHRTNPPWRTFAGMTILLSHAQNVLAMARPPADPNASPPPAWVQFFPIVVMVLIFYILLIRPQMNQKKQREKMMNTLKKGDRIVTQGGFLATVVNVGPDFLEVKLNEETKVKIQRSAVAEVVAEKNDGKEPGLVTNGK